MKFKKLLILFSAFALCSCGEETTNKQGQNSEEGPTVQYALWPEEDMKIVVQGIDETATDIIPAFGKATKITIDWQMYLDEGNFGIYCETKDPNSVFEYKTILQTNGYDVDTVDDDDGYLNAFSPNGELWLNYGYNALEKQLEIYATEGMFVHWPTAVISEKVASLVHTLSVVPSITATRYEINTPQNVVGFAINIWGVEDNVIASYKATVEQAGWRTEADEGSGYFAYSPDEKLKINFYLDDEHFNIDVFPYVKPVTDWPYEQISELLTTYGLTGEVLPFTGANNGFEVNDDYFPPAIYVYVEKGKQVSSAQAYNQMLIDYAYEVVGTYGGDDVYGKQGTTLAYHGVYLAGSCFTIELLNISQITPL